MKNRPLFVLGLILILIGCGRPSENESDQSSFGAALESSFTQSAQEEKARVPVRQKQQQIKDWQARQEQLQQERLESYQRSGSEPLPQE